MGWQPTTIPPQSFLTRAKQVIDDKLLSLFWIRWTCTVSKNGQLEEVRYFFFESTAMAFHWERLADGFDTVTEPV